MIYNIVYWRNLLLYTRIIVFDELEMNNDIFILFTKINSQY